LDERSDRYPPRTMGWNVTLGIERDEAPTTPGKDKDYQVNKPHVNGNTRCG
jgi:hypothetical protein